MDERVHEVCGKPEGHQEADERFRHGSCLDPVAAAHIRGRAEEKEGAEQQVQKIEHVPPRMRAGRKVMHAASDFDWENGSETSRRYKERVPRERA